MNEYYTQNWPPLEKRTFLHVSLIVSVVLHVVLLAVLFIAARQRIAPVRPTAYEVTLAPANMALPEAQPQPKPAPPPEPIPPPPVEEDLEPPKPPEPEPAEQSEIALKPKEEKKPEPPKVEKKPEPPKAKEKPEPEPPKPKPEPPKPKEEVAPEPSKPEPPAPAPDAPRSSTVTMHQQLPSALSSWGRLVQRKVEAVWRVPTGIILGADENRAVVSFFVSRDGQLIGEPQVISMGTNPVLAESGVRAIQLAAPFPPLPGTYPEPEQQVIYAFTLGNQ